MQGRLRHRGKGESNEGLMLVLPTGETVEVRESADTE